MSVPLAYLACLRVELLKVDCDEVPQRPANSLPCR